MSALNHFEQFMENMVEGSVARLFRSPVQPAEIAKRLERAMESQQTISVKRIIVPNVYRAYLNSQDFVAFQPIKEEMEREMAVYLRELADERGFSMLEHPKVLLEQDPDVARRSIQIVAETVGSHVSASNHTQVMSGTSPLSSAPVNKSPAMLLLKTSQGPHHIPLESTLLTIGRGLSNDIILEDTRVSRHHAQLRYKTRRFWVTDLGSTNGTLVNGERVNESPLRDGDTISLGGLEMTFREG